jgi:hypothetical protein
LLLQRRPPTARDGASASTAGAAAPSGEEILSTIFDSAPGSLKVGGLAAYGILDFTVTYQNHGAPPSPYMNGAKNSGSPIFVLTNNALSQSLLGLKVDHPAYDLFGVPEAKDWSFVGDAAIAFDPTFGVLQDSCRSLVRERNEQRSRNDGKRRQQPLRSIVRRRALRGHKAHDIGRIALRPAAKPSVRPILYLRSAKAFLRELAFRHVRHLRGRFWQHRGQALEQLDQI